MKWILTLLGGGSGGWILGGALAACLALGGGLGWFFTSTFAAKDLAEQKTLTAQASERTSQCVASHEKARADGSEKALDALSVATANAAQAMENLATKARARGQSLDQFLKEIANAPPSKVCGSSPAELAYRRSVIGLRGPADAAAPTP